MAADDLRLVDELRALGRLLERPDGPDGADGADDPAGRLDVDALADAVTTRVRRLPAPRPSRPGRWRHLLDPARRRRILVTVVVVLLSLTGIPAVRAAVADLFGFDGVRVQIRPGPVPTVTPTPPAASGGVSLRQAAGLVHFRPVALTGLGPPDDVQVSADRRVLSMSWRTDRGTVRLDEFDGKLDYTFAKTARGVEFLTVGSTGSTTGLWFDEPHEVVVLDAAGNPRTETARAAGQTLIWEATGAVLRLEGDIGRPRAVELASSARPLD